jgi:hypothetical protein
MTVFVQEDRIASIVPSARARSSKTERRSWTAWEVPDPALWDMHVHVANLTDPR